MKINKALAAALISGVALMAAIACQGAPPASSPTDTTPVVGIPTTPPAPNLPPVGQSDIEMAEVLAPIESVEINIAESFPPQYFVAIQSGLPSGCAQFNDYQVSRDGNTVKIEVTNLEPAAGQQVACTAIYGYHDTNINLGSDFVGDETYSVAVNGSVTETFVAQYSGAVKEEDGANVSEPAPIEYVAINVDAVTGDAELVVTTGLPNSCYESGSASLVLDGEVIRADVANLKPADQNIVCAEIYRTVETSLALESPVEPCETYTVIANGKEYSVQAIAPNVRCANPNPFGQPLPGAPDYPTVVVPAPIESVLIISTRSLPPINVVKIISGLPSGCAQFNDYDVVREGNEIRISVTNLMPDPESVVMCTQIYGYQDTSVNIGSDFEDGVEYSVYVNNYPAETFMGIGGPASSQSQIEIPIGKSIEVDLDGLALQFTEVREDSRCPSNVVCIWAGQAKVLIAATHGDEDLGEHEVLLDPTGNASNSVTIGDYNVALIALNPYPSTAGSASNSEYVATVSVSQTSSEDEGSANPEVSVRAELVPNEPWAVTLIAEIVGGADNNEDLYCVGTEWQFGDGNGMAMMPSCLPWTPESTMQRYFEETYTYEGPGTYEVTFTHGPVSATTVVEIH